MRAVLAWLALALLSVANIAYEISLWLSRQLYPELRCFSIDGRHGRR